MEKQCKEMDNVFDIDSYFNLIVSKFNRVIL